MKDFVAQDWRESLAANGLDSFERLWALEAGWFEAPNERRGGWSGVSRLDLQLPGGGTAGVFVKRQANHVCRTLAHPLRGMLTFEREFRNLQYCRARGIATLEPVYCAVRRQAGQRRAVLVTRELAGYVSLEQAVARWRVTGPPPRAWRNALIARVAAVAARLHRHRLQHNCLYPKHVFITAAERPDVRLIDLEKTKRRLRRASARLRDLDTLNRHAREWSRTDRLRFLLAYHGRARVDARVRRDWRRLARRHAGKGRG